MAAFHIVSIYVLWCLIATTAMSIGMLMALGGLGSNWGAKVVNGATMLAAVAAYRAGNERVGSQPAD